MPSHINIAGNELADKAAKEATREINLYRLPLNIDEYNSLIKKRISKLWQNEWDKDWKTHPCHLYRIKPTMGDWKSSYRENRREEVVLSRLRTGTCRYLFQHHFRVENLAPLNKCNLCGVTNTIEHLILTCPKWGAFRIPIYNHIMRLKLPISLSSVLGDSFKHNVLFSYLKSIKYFDLI